MDYREYQRQKARSSNIWWGVTALCFCSGAGIPLAIILLVLRYFDKLPVIGSPSDAKSQKVYQKPAPNSVQEKAVDTRRAVRGKKHLKRGKLMIAAGIVLLCAGLLGAVQTVPQQFDFWSVWRAYADSAVCLFGGLGLVLFGEKRKKSAARMQRYLRMIGSQTAISIHEMAQFAGCSYKQCCEDLQRMIDMDMWEHAWLDLERGRLMLTEYDPELLPRKKAGTQPEQQSQTERVLQQIRADNALIDDEEISKKIDRIEVLTEKILQFLEKNPDREEQLRTFLNYYLPQTLKTLETYARLEAQHIDTQSVREAKAQISQVLDQLAEGFETQLDKLLSEDMLDISADIRVMEQMLKRDGLLDEDVLQPEKKKQQEF